MERYAHRENIARYQLLLAETNVTKDQVRHTMLLELLAAEVAKARHGFVRSPDGTVRAFFEPTISSPPHLTRLSRCPRP
jgi:hypothetical protein